MFVTESVPKTGPTNEMHVKKFKKKKKSKRGKGKDRTAYDYGLLELSAEAVLAADKTASFL